MTQHQAHISWRRGANEAFSDARYSRAHTWTFDGGAKVAASSSPHNVPLPYSKPENVDPEEALVAAISSCHMLTFLHRAALAGYVVDSYEDPAVGLMGEFQAGKPAVVKAILRPRIVYRGPAPSEEQANRLHHEAHELCFIANSLLTEVCIEQAHSFG